MEDDEKRKQIISKETTNAATEEIVKIKLEVNELKTELIKLKGQGSRKWWWTLIQTLITIIVTGGVTLYSSKLLFKSAEADRQLKVFTQLKDDFSSDHSATRAAAAARLGFIACCDPEHPNRNRAKPLLLAALGTEESASVIRAIEQALVAIRPDVTEEVTKRRNDLNREIVKAFGLGSKPNCESKSLEKELPKIRVMQEGILLSARILAQLQNSSLDLKNSEFRCAQLYNLDLHEARLQGAILWQADLSFANLENANLSGAQVDGAKFVDARISGASLCGAETARGLRQDPTGILKAKGWQEAYYPVAVAAKLLELRGVKVRPCIG